MKELYIQGAKEHNLKNIDVRIPRDKLVVITGLSGSGKSSLAFDTIYAEGQRRYMESLSSYARQFLGQMEKPNVDHIEGLSPAISIDQKTTNRNPRSTVGTVTEIHDYLRLLYARIGIPHCPVCGKRISSMTVDQIVDILISYPEKTKISLLAPVIRERKGTHEKVLETIKKEGFNRVRVDGTVYNLDEDEIKLEKTYKHSIEIVVDRLVVKDGISSRLSEAIETVLAHGDGGLVIADIQYHSGAIDNEGKVRSLEEDNLREEKLLSTKLSCPDCGVSIEQLEPRMFSFNNPFGACQVCNGLGYIQKIDQDLIITDTEKSIPEGVLSKVFASMEFSGFYRQMIDALAEDNKVDISLPWKDLPKKFREEVLYGTGERHLKYTYTSRSSGRVSQMNHPFEGVITNMERRYRESSSDYIKDKFEQFMIISECESCHGKRLKPEVLAVTVGELNIAQLSDLSVNAALKFIDTLKLTEQESAIAEEIQKEIRKRFSFLVNVGLDYLTLSRGATTLSGGESQRIRLATQIGSSLVGVMYILDEPSIGLHQKDNHRLLRALRELTDLGNTLIVVEHDEDTMMAADHIVDIGPGAGNRGGHIVAEGTAQEIMENPHSLTGKYLSGKKKIEVPATRRTGEMNEKTGKLNFIRIKGAEANNLKRINVDIPLGMMVCVTGVSGSGKSTLVNEILYKAVTKKINKSRVIPGKHKGIDGIEYVDKIIEIDQSPIGKTPRSNPATYTKMFDHIRELFSQTKESKVRGYQKGRFSFNVKGGRCEACKGDGIIKIEMHFLPDVYVPCEVCHGKRYNRETLEVKYKDKSIYDVLEMTIKEAATFFKDHPNIVRPLKTLLDVGLGYVKLGQPSTQLSGGESQRVKLAAELSKSSTGHTLYILDEPTTGLHFADVHKLAEVIDRLVDQGNTVVIIEHNLDIIKRADYIIDLGPDGGDRGGTVLVTGTPEKVADFEESYTGQYLKRLL